MSTSTKTMTLANIQHIDGGRPMLAVNHALRQCTADIVDRPADKSKRKVVLVITQEPQLDKSTGALDTIGVQFKVKTSIPDRQSKLYPMLPTGENTVTFEPHAPNDPRQAALFGEAEAQAVPPRPANVAETGEVLDDEESTPDVGEM